jgi:hypothetical protein
LSTSSAQFDDAVEVYEKYTDQEFSFTDIVTIALVDHHDIDAALSFGDDFDGLTERFVPAVIAECTFGRTALIDSREDTSREQETFFICLYRCSGWWVF